MQEQTLVIPALLVVEEPHETLLSPQAKQFRMRDGKREETGLGGAKLHLQRKKTKLVF